MVVSNHKGVSSGEDTVGFNALVTSWPAILRQAGSPGSVHPELGS
jgi:hypothetical protein